MLTDRQKRIMIAVVEGYTESPNAEPIGSSALSLCEGLDVSTATLRNEMALLEEMGYLEKTHTSSGRIPTEKGYRLYVEELMNIDDIQEELDEQVAQYFENSKLSKKETLSKLVESIVNNKDFNYGTVILEKTAYNSLIKKIEFVYLKNRRGIFILVTDQGLVLHRETSIPEGINIQSIENTMEFLNDKLHDVLLNDFKNAKVINITTDNFFDYISNAPAVLELCLRNIRKLVDDKRTIIGQYNILNHHDFADLNLAQSYIECLKNGDIYQIVEFDAGPIPVIASDDNASISIKLGSENNLEIMKKCACVTAYFKSKHHTGAITIYGPLRMKYRQVISFLKALVNNMK
ncbi:MAG: heat-inducible transcription repressor HrcA [Bacilli bacterium]|nr:heat-inducible transcription repressor HrcA [Bacilli bacterium]